VLQRIFYALEDTRTPFLMQLVQSGLFAIGILVVATGPVSEIANGIALVMSLSTYVQAGLMALLLRRRIGHLGGRALGLAMTKFLLASIPSLGVGFLVLDALPASGDSLLTAVGLAAAVSAVVGLVYFGVLLALRDRSAQDLLAPLRRSGNNRP
jgi:putative peptidoglycan lipid II flippase